MQKIIAILFLFSSLFSLSAEEIINDFTKGQELYRADNNEEAILVFESFIEAAPADERADDALWYLGRLYVRIGEQKRAEEAFRTVLGIEDSNRRTEAFYDLAKLLDKQDREDEVIDILPIIYPDYADDSYAVKALPRVFKSYSLTGSRYRNAGLGEYAEILWLEALNLISSYENIDLEAENAEILAQERIKFLNKLAGLTSDIQDFNRYKETAGKALSEYAAVFPDSERLSALESDFEALNELYRDFDMKAAVSAYYNKMTETPGVYARLGIGGDTELVRNSLLRWSIDYKHEPFDFKTFNFSDLKTGNERFFEVTDRISGKLKFDLGSKYFTLNRFSVGADVMLAEDIGDFNYGGDLGWDFTKSIGRSGIFSLDNGFSAGFYPDYQNAGREISNIKLSTAPGYTFIFNPGLSLGVEYGFDYKYYLNAHYDTIDMGIDPETRRYFIHDISAGLNLSPAKWLEAGFDYSFSYLDSVNYDLWLYGTPQNQFVEDFYDYYINSIGLDIKIDASFYSGDFGAGYSLRKFINYPARNESKVFTDELRQDSEIYIDMKNRFEIFQPQDFGSLAISLDGELNMQTSNHTYEVSYITNYLNWKLSVGAEWTY